MTLSEINVHKNKQQQIRSVIYTNLPRDEYLRISGSCLIIMIPLCFSKNEDSIVFFKDQHVFICLQMKKKDMKFPLK